MITYYKRRFFRYIQVIPVMLLCLPMVIAQDLPATKMVRVGPSYQFKDGIYLNTEMVKTNRPIPPARIVSDADMYNDKFYNELLDHEYVVLYDNRGMPGRLNAKEIWGYAFNGSLYIQVGGHFHKINLEGSISRFIASATTYVKKPLSSFDSTHYTPNYYNPYSKRYVYANPTIERKVYLLDFENNTMYEETPDALEKLFLRDYELYTEYSALKRRERKERQLEFIQRYNARHPLYFPVNNSN
jgi:hypothetical protein